MIYPWEKIVKLCKEFGALSMVDGAHSIGQHKVDVVTSGCDFFVSVRWNPVRPHKLATDNTELSQVAYGVSDDRS